MIRSEILAGFLLSSLTGCFVTEADLADASDRDGDGFIAQELGGLDCDDGEETTFPGARENCLDSIDSDCDGLTCPETIVARPETWAAGTESDSRPELTGAVGDFTGDGVVELLVSDPEAARGEGLVFRFELPLDLDAEGSLQERSRGFLRGEGERGLRAFSAGDLDGDGDAEVALSSIVGPGRTALIDALPPAPGEVGGYPDVLLVEEASPGVDEGVLSSGISYGGVQALGDRTGDGLGDFLLASPGHPGGGTERGLVFLITEAVSGETDAEEHASTAFAGEHDQAWLGSTLGRPGDTDGDGVSEILIGSSGWSQQPEAEGAPMQVGAVYLFHEVSSGLVQAEDADARIDGRYANSRLVRCDSVGDLDGDGLDDVGCAKGAGGGQALFFLGPVEGALLPEDSQVQLVGDVGPQVTVGFGEVLRGGLDVDADGRGDVLINADEQDVGEVVAAGAAFLFHGPLTGVLSPDHASMRWEGSVTRGTMELGEVVDVDASGAPDLLFHLPFHLDLLGDTDPGAVLVDLDPFERLGG